MSDNLTIKPKPKPLLFRVFVGGVACQNVNAFIPAFNQVKLEYQDRLSFIYEAITNEDVRKAQLSEQQFANWLAEGDIYFIIDHPTLGLSNMQSSQQGYWHPWDLGKAMDVAHAKLLGRIGWPEDVRCPIVWQNKIAYKQHLKSMCTPFLVLSRTEDGRLSKETKAIIFE